MSHLHNESIHHDCVNLLIKTRVGFRGLSKIIQHLNLFSHVPHFTSLINWVLRFGLGLLKQVQPISEPWIAIIDHSIDIGSKKVLVVLRVKARVLESKKSIQLADCECIGLQIQQAINGEHVANALMAIFKTAGYPQAMIQDGDSSLNCGVNRVAASQIPVIHDISHVVSAALKKALTIDPRYQTFLDLRLRFNSQFRQTDYACLLFPKIRNKGRFMDIGKQFAWAHKLLQIKNNQNVQFNRFQQSFLQLNEWIEEFMMVTTSINQMMKQLKTQGLNEEMLKTSKQLMNQLSEESSVKQRLLQWLDETFANIQHVSVCCPISSDVIESLFGLFKYLIGRNPQADMNRSVLLLPALCGQSDPETIQQALSQTRQTDLNAWVTEHIPETIRQARKRLLG